MLLCITLIRWFILSVDFIRTIDVGDTASKGTGAESTSPAQPRIRKEIDGGDTASKGTGAESTSPVQPRIVKKMGIVVRTFANNTDMAMSMVYSVLSQAKDIGWETIVYLAFTEQDEIASRALSTLVNETFTGKGESMSVLVFIPPDSVYTRGSTILTSQCTPLYITSLQVSERVVCTIDCPLHYIVTDSALNHMLDRHSDLQSLIVTNADNVYLPRFLRDAVETMQRTKADIVLTDMLHRRKPRRVYPKIGRVDLGAAVISVPFIRSNNLSFTHALRGDGPKTSPTPLMYYRADGIFIERAVKLGGRVAYVRKLNFVHN